MTHYLSKEITKNDKTLAVLLTSFNGENIPIYTIELISDVFAPLSECLSDGIQTLYIRDITFLSIDGKWIGGHCFNRHEAMIALPSWNLNKKELHASLAHELHHMVRWQNGGYGKTLGGAILSEGIATYYSELISGWTPPWSGTKLTESMIEAAKKEWDNDKYDHSDWFFKGSQGRWAGYSIGYWLASKIYEQGFNLGNSASIKPSEVVHILDEF